MRFLEKDLEDIIHSTSNRQLEDRGLIIKGFKLRQVRIGNYGVADLITIQKFANLMKNQEGKENSYCNGHRIKVTIFELKKDQITSKTLSQALRYFKGVSEYINSVVVDKYELLDYDIDLVLIGSRIESDMYYAGDFFDNLTIYKYEYNLNGLYFKKLNNYSLVENGFKL